MQQPHSRGSSAGLLSQPFYGWVGRGNEVQQPRSRGLPAGLLAQSFYGWVGRQ